jgi:Holliday junction resolvase RusA-like endonuclease
VLIFTIPGSPCGWRTQHTGRHLGRGKVAVSTRLANPGRSWQTNAIRIMREAYKGETLSGPLSVSVSQVFARPKRLDCHHVRACSCGPERLSGASQPYTSTPDATNVHKLAEDALTKAGVIEDDRMVCRYSGEARYAARDEHPHVQISVEILT